MSYSSPCHGTAHLHCTAVVRSVTCYNCPRKVESLLFEYYGFFCIHVVKADIVPCLRTNRGQKRQVVGSKSTLVLH